MKSPSRQQSQAAAVPQAKRALLPPQQSGVSKPKQSHSKSKQSHKQLLVLAKQSKKQQQKQQEKEEDKQAQFVSTCMTRMEENLVGKLQGDYQIEGTKWIFGREYPEHAIRGGFVCDDVGMGKTNQIVAAIAGNKLDNGTLVVALLPTVSHWRETFKEFAGINATVLSASSKMKLGSNPGVVIIPYSALSFAKKLPAVLNRHWGRVVLDEGHTIRNPGTKACTFINELECDIKWILTATPIQNSEAELISLAETIGIKTSDTKDIIDKYYLRRTQAAEGAKDASVALPALITKVVKIPFADAAEKLFYKAIHDVYIRRLDEVESKGGAKFRNTAVECFMRLRQVCAHPCVLVSSITKAMGARKINLLKQSGVKRSFIDTTAKPKTPDPSPPPPSSDTPPLKADKADDADKADETDDTLSFKAVKRQVKRKVVLEDSDDEDMPNIFAPLANFISDTDDSTSEEEEQSASDEEQSASEEPEPETSRVRSAYADVLEAITEEDTDKMQNVEDLVKHILSQGADITNHANVFGSKIDYLVKDIIEHRPAKSLVFCSFIEEMNLISKLLDEHDISYVCFDGSMGRNDKDNAINNFQTTDIEVMILQVKCGSTGLNLQAASRVYIMTPNYNPCVDIQAVGRSHRKGQDKPVTCIRLVIEGTVDERCLDISNEKLDIITSALNDDNYSAKLGGTGKTNVGEMTNADLRNLILS